MSSSVTSRTSDQWTRSDGEWWVLLVTDGLTVEFPPELYRDQARAESECERWAHLLSWRSGEAIERPFEGRWQVGDRWIRLVHAFLPDEGPEIWIGTFWGRNGSPEPEAALFASSTEAQAWAIELPPGGLPIETHETPWSVTARFRVRGGEEEAEVHKGKVVADPIPRTGPPELAVFWGFEVSEGLIPQGPGLFTTKEARDRALRRLLEREMAHRDWRDFVRGTAEGNYAEHELPEDWRKSWTESQALDWLVAFGFIGDGDDLEIRCFETSVD